VVVSGILWVTASAPARAQGAARDQSGALTASPTDQSKSWFERRFSGSYAELSTYFGSGTFYVSGYHNPYISNAVYLRPTFQLGTKYNLALNARVYLEEEYTQPDNPTGRRFYPLDTWLYLTAKNLYTHPSSKIRISGALRAVIPTSYESSYAHLVTGLTAQLTANRAWEFGTPDSQGKRWGATLSLGTGFAKFFRTSPLRGNDPGGTSGCALPSAAAPVASHTGADGFPTISEADRCGGPLSTSYSFGTVAVANLTRKRWTLGMTLFVTNEFHYSVPHDQFTPMNAVSVGRVDTTWGILSLGYDLTEHLGVSVGVSSQQPALNSTDGSLRFPFFDFKGGAGNNYTQAFVGLNGTI
jgi:hypothetical protein